MAHSHLTLLEHPTSTYHPPPLFFLSGFRQDVRLTVEVAEQIVEAQAPDPDSPAGRKLVRRSIEGEGVWLRAKCRLFLNCLRRHPLLGRMEKGEGRKLNRSLSYH